MRKIEKGPEKNRREVILMRGNDLLLLSSDESRSPFLRLSLPFDSIKRAIPLLRQRKLPRKGYEDERRARLLGVPSWARCPWNCGKVVLD